MNKRVPPSKSNLALSLLAVLPFFPLLGACGQPPPEAAATAQSPASPDGPEMLPAATVVSRTGTTVEIYKLERGGYFVVEYGNAALPAALAQQDTQALSLSELYRKVTGGRDVPSDIATLSAQVSAEGVAASRRASDLKAILPAPLPATTHAAAASGSCSSTWFVQQGFCEFGPHSWCLLDWWDGAYEYSSDTRLSSAHVCADIGDVLWQVKNGDGGFHQWVVKQGFLLRYSLYDSSGTSLRYDVLQASGNRFQFGGVMY